MRGGSNLYIGLGAASFAQSLLSAVFGMYTTRVFFEHFGLEPAGFTLAHVFFLVFNAVNDPVLGAVLDSWAAVTPSSNRRKARASGRQNGNRVRSLAAGG